MPTVLTIGPYRFYFYSDEGDEPPHIHVRRDMASIKFWLDPVRKGRNDGFRPHEIKHISRLIRAHRDNLLRSWNVYFGR